MDKTKQPGIKIAQVFLQAAQFSHRVDPLTFPAETQAAVGEVDITIEVGEQEDKRAGVLRLAVATKPTSEAVYDFRIQMVALFQAEEVANMPLIDFLRGPAISILFPFVREAVANVTGRGRFGPIWVQPFNFQATGEAANAAKAASAPAVSATSPTIAPRDRSHSGRRPKR